MPYYEISLKIRIKKEDYELSYYEVWRKEMKHLDKFMSPILDTVFKRDKPPFKMPEDNDMWSVLVENKKGCFEKGRNLIRDSIKHDPSVSLHFGDME
jgi:hypothetical protein